MDIRSLLPPGTRAVQCSGQYPDGRVLPDSECIVLSRRPLLEVAKLYATTLSLGMNREDWLPGMVARVVANWEAPAEWLVSSPQEEEEK